MRVLKRHVGRPVDFLAAGITRGTAVNGVIEQVRNGIVAVRYWAVRDQEGNLVAHAPEEGFVAYLKVRSVRILAIH
jgi:hypothetical protein